MQPDAAPRALNSDLAELLRPDTGRSALEKALASGLFYSGALRILEKVSRVRELRRMNGSRIPRWKRVTTPKFAILCYHRVGTGGVPLYSSLPPAVFEAQMQFLRKRYRVVSLSEVVASLNDPSAEPGVAVTFDDGYRDVFHHAFPTLCRYEIPATIFLTVDGIENGEAPWYDHVFLALQVAEFDTLELELHQPVRYSLTSPGVRFHAALDIVMRLRKLPDQQRQVCLREIKRRISTASHDLAGKMLTWEQVLTMQQAGVHFGSHTLTHPVVSRLQTSQLETELRDSKRLLEEKLRTPVEDFAFPFGQADDCGTAPRPVLVACGYRSAATTIWGVNERGVDPYALRRVQIGEERSLDMFAFQLNQLFLRASDPPAGVDSPAPMAFAAPFRSAIGDAEGPR